MRLRLLIAACLLVTVSSGEVAAADTNGEFLGGGAAGAASCPAFQNAMTTYRLRSDIGTIDPFLEWASGFRSGYNWQAFDTYDIFGGLGALDVLYSIEPHCLNRPDRSFFEAVFELAKQFYANRVEQLTPHNDPISIGIRNDRIMLDASARLHFTVSGNEAVALGKIGSPSSIVAMVFGYADNVSACNELAIILNGAGTEGQFACVPASALGQQPP